MLIHQLLWLAVCCGFATSEHRGNDTEKQSTPVTHPLLLVSFDGFRADYLKTYSFPHFQKFVSDGVRVGYLTNVFTTKTFPNHYSLVTGLYAESHGILASRMYDPQTHKTFTIGDTDPSWWEEATPIWVSVQNSGYKSAAAMWPGSDLKIKNSTATHFFPYSPKVTFQERIGNLTKWLKDDSDVRFAALYWEEPDRSGHRYGPNNTVEMAKALKEVDNNIGLLMEQLQQANLWGKINVILTSDHGMTQCSEERLIKLDNCLNRTDYSVVDLTPVAAIMPLNNVSRVYNLLNKCHPQMKVYMKENIPERLHYKYNERIQPIILVAEEGWTIVQNGSLPRLGDHGYDNSLPSMHPFLAAHGPAFRKGYHLSNFNSIDIYPLMCHLLGIQALPNNGSFVKVRCMLESETCADLAVTVGIVIGVLIVLTTLTCLFRLMKSRGPSPSRPFARLELQDDDDDDPLLD
ncbi:bis(5'-adenosyl)-triphosphatase enpp4 [Alosa pseudoharengus]|uniref:bis(5'-adenosyl)-triphosphatase enpp4 n=1 Tax=Alosa pseudoharengus TaxID=34774 RepID=UPI003F8ADE96